jgi:heme oxygenase
MTTSLTQRLGDATREVRDALEQSPYFAALRQGALPLAAYVNALRSLGLLHEAFEEALGTGGGVAGAAWQAWHGVPARVPLLARDLDELGALAPEVPRAIVRAMALAEQLRARAADDAAWALGYLYVLEAEPVGALVWRDGAVAGAGLAGGRGTEYASSYGEAGAEGRRALVARFDGLGLEPGVRERATAVAREAYAGLAGVFESIHPPAGDDWPSLARALNPVAGAHPITEDVPELRAALRAGERTWHQFPYYEHRFGPRGRRFMRSDAGWLAHLSARPAAEVERQVAWLGGVLAARGMPQWMLECHLDDLSAELGRARPDRRERYELLRRAAGALRAERVARIDDVAFARLGAEFDAAVGPEWQRRMPRSGGLLASAVADEANGHGHAVESLVEWLGSPRRFPRPWLTAVAQTVAEARRVSRLR